MTTDPDPNLDPNQELSNELPYNDYYEYYGPDYNLHIQPSTAENLNMPDALEKIKNKVQPKLKPKPEPRPKPEPKPEPEP